MDRVFEPLMARQGALSPLVWLLGMGKGSGAALLFLILEFVGVVTCIIFLRDGHIRALEQ